MTDHDALRMRFRIANPVPDPDAIDAPELDRILLGIESQWDEARGLASPSKAPDRVRRSRLAPVLAFAAAALLILLAVGLPMLLMGGEDVPPVDETTIVSTTTAITVPPTTVATTLPPNPTTTTAAPQVAIAPPMSWERVPHQAIFEDATIFRVVNGGPGLVAVGALGEWNTFETLSLAEGGAQAVVYVSSDGYEWERIDSPAYVADTSTTMWGVAVGPDGLLVAPGLYGHDDVFFLSANGLTWERIAREGIDFVTSTETGFIGFGSVSSAGGSGRDAAVWLSTDGRDWTRIEDDAFVATEADDWAVGVDSVTEGGPGLVAIGSSGLSQTNAVGLPGVDRMAVWVSADGMEWERLADLEDESPGSVSSDPESERIIAFGAHMWTSIDGYTWTKTEQQDPRIQPRWWASLAWNGERVVAGGGDVNLSLWASGNRGETWSRIDPNDPVFDGFRPGISGVVRLGDDFVAVGGAGDYGAEVGAVWIGTWDE